MWLYQGWLLSANVRPQNIDLHRQTCTLPPSVAKYSIFFVFSDSAADMKPSCGQFSEEGYTRPATFFSGHTNARAIGLTYRFSHSLFQIRNCQIASAIYPRRMSFDIKKMATVHTRRRTINIHFCDLIRVVANWRTSCPYIFWTNPLACHAARNAIRFSEKPHRKYWRNTALV